MPNCDFYAVEEDHKQLLDWLLDEGTCRVFELYSEFEKPLREFQTVGEILTQFCRTSRNGNRWETVHLQLYVVDASPPFIPRRVNLNPKACDGATYRYTAEGWGLVQLYLSEAGSDGLRNSHTNHNSQKRAESWAPVRTSMDSVGAWDFKKITLFSSRLNRQIKKLSVARIGSRPVLPGALELWDAGVSLVPFHQGGTATVVRADA
jgi:hypothetical protein